MSTLWKGITGNGGNRFFEKNGELMVAGADVAGRQKLTKEKFEDVWDIQSVSAGGNVTGPNPGIKDNASDADNVVRLGGNDVNGKNIIFTFNTKKEAESFEKFLTDLDSTGSLADAFEAWY